MPFCRRVPHKITWPSWQSNAGSHPVHTTKIWLASAKLRKGYLFAIYVPNVILFFWTKIPGLCQGNLPRVGTLVSCVGQSKEALRNNAVPFFETILQFRHFFSSCHSQGPSASTSLCDDGGSSFNKTVESLQTYLTT